mgnify:CR=1 FL=1
MKKRNGLLEIYRFILSFWPMYCHNFFFLENRGVTFSVPELAPDFFFVLSGFFLLNSFRKNTEEPTLLRMVKLVYGRAKPLLFSVCFIASFNFLCIGLFLRDDVFNSLFMMFRYWWYILYLLIALAIFFIIYKGIKNEKLFGVFLGALAVLMALLHYSIKHKGFLSYEFGFPARTFGCMAVGMLVSYIPKFKTKRFNISVIPVVILFSALMYLAYAEKDYIICLVMIVMFAALVYFSSNISVGGIVFDILGHLGTRMYLYMSFVTTLYLLGLTNHRILFVIDVALSVLDMLIYHYRKKSQDLTPRNS